MKACPGVSSPPPTPKQTWQCLVAYTCMGIRENYGGKQNFGLYDSIQNMEVHKNNISTAWQPHVAWHGQLLTCLWAIVSCTHALHTMVFIIIDIVVTSPCRAGWYVCCLSGKGVMYGHYYTSKTPYMALHPKLPIVISVWDLYSTGLVSADLTTEAYRRPTICGRCAC